MRRITLLAASALALSPVPARANDGRNRYEGSVPAVLHHLFAPVSPQAGFRVLPGDMPGGADGDPAFRWAQRHALAVVRLAARATVVAFGTSPYPLAIFDLSSENGDTPVDLGKDGPRGRHPGGSHDGGYNLDLGYYLTSEKGKLESPDPAACTEHYSAPRKAGDKPKDENKCLGPADRLDVDRQAMFLLELVKLHQGRFAGELLENIGIDAEVRKAVLARVRQWTRKRRFGATAALGDELERLCASSPYEGWARFHHHHIHVRLLPLDPGGKHARAYLAVEAEDRRLEAALLAEAGDPAASDDVALAAELHSYNLGRAIDLRLIGGGLSRVRKVRFRLDGGAWQAPEDPLEPLHHVVDLPARATWVHATARAEAEVELEGGERRMLRRNVALPRQPGVLRVKVDPARITARARLEAGYWELGLEMPPAYGALVTRVEFVLHRSEGEPERIALPAPAYAARVKDRGPAELVEAEVMLSGRVKVRIPAWVATPPGPPANAASAAAR